MTDTALWPDLDSPYPLQSSQIEAFRRHGCIKLKQVLSPATLAHFGREITQLTIDLNTEPQLKPYVDLPRMAQMSLKMLRSALDAFVQRLPDEARGIIPSDARVDELNRQLHRELSSFMIESPANISRCLSLMAISRSLERVADHATNIAEEVVYLYEARDIRHSKIKPNETENPGS
jgi:phosphate transport system protein